MKSGNSRGDRSSGVEVPVVLVVPPIINHAIPTLGAAILAPACHRVGIRAQVHYANISFAAKVGFELSERLSCAPPRTMLGEAVFWGAAFPDRAHEHIRILETLSQEHDPMAEVERLPRPTADELTACVAKIPSFLAETAERVLAASPRIVGLSSMCQQTLASIAIAREIKRRRPEVVVVLGGANAAEPMGSALLEITDAIDFVFSGEADLAFPAFCRDYVLDDRLPVERVIQCAPIHSLDQVASPDYDDYYAQIEPLRKNDPLSALAPLWLLFESSRGCWWADLHNCSFCGFNAPGASFRSKSPERVISEIDDLAAKYGIRQMYASDTIMAGDLPSSVLARLAERGSSCSLAYEVKSNLDEEDLDVFVRAGVVEIQPGIESLSNHVLRLMYKGVKALENIRLLRDACSRGIEIIWNFLTCIPGERRQDYEEMLALLPLLEHLRPPTRWGPIRISRYSPYYRDPARHGIKRLQPWTAYREFYGDRAPQFAHHFTGEYESGFTADPELMARFQGVIRRWAEAWLQTGDAPALYRRTLDDGRVVVRDTRAVARAEIHVLSPEILRTLEQVHRPKSAAQIPEDQRSAIDHLVALGLVACHEGEFLALPVEPEIGERLLCERRMLLDRGPRLGSH